MLRTKIINTAKSGLSGCARPLTRQPGIRNVRSAMYKSDRPDGSTSRLEMTPKTWAAIGGCLAVCAGYGYMMGTPQKVVRSEGSTAATTERAAMDTKSKNP
ncbi:hypothetical protein VTK26DRAFT_9004 [Humicola hyalothermophila]